MHIYLERIEDYDPMDVKDEVEEKWENLETRKEEIREKYEKKKQDREEKMEEYEEQ